METLVLAPVDDMESRKTRTMILLSALSSHMNHSFTFFIGCIVLILLLVFPATGADVLIKATGTDSAPALATSPQPFISARASPSEAPAGTPVTISGMATGGNLTAGVQIWVFAGNYVNVTTTPVSADGSFAKTYSTTGLPPATYYVIVQSPGIDGTLNIVMETSGQYSGQVVNARTGELIFNFTGTGSVQDSAAAQALSDAFNLPGCDDIYTKCTFQMISPSATAPASSPVAPVPETTTKKSPLTLLPLMGGMAGAALLLVLSARR